MAVAVPPRQPFPFPLPEWIHETPASVQLYARILRQKRPSTITATEPWRQDLLARLRTPHAEQARFIESDAKRKVVRGGRRGGKTVGLGIFVLRRFAAGRRILYGVPTQEQLDRLWSEVKRACDPFVEQGILYKNETRHIIEVPGTENRIRAKSAWNADTLRGDYCDDLILDEYQLMAEDAWGEVGAPMLIDTDGDAIFAYTVPSMASTSVSKARDKQHVAQLYKDAQADTSGRWATFTFSSYANPHTSHAAIDALKLDMSLSAFRREILAEEDDENPHALWNTGLIRYRALGI